MSFIKKELWRLRNNVVWSWQGWATAWATENTLRQWTIVNVISAVATFCVDFSSVERGLIIGFGLLILVVELLNTAIEECVDYISEDQHPRAKRAKDIGSAAVALTAITAGIMWVLMLFG